MSACDDLKARPDRFVACFARSFYDPSLYARGGWCAENVYRLLARFIEIGVDMNEIKVLFITPTPKFDPTQSLFPFQERFGTPGVGMAEWSFHVVLEYGRQIFDLDFEQNPTVVGTTEYFQTMFHEKSVYLKIVDAAEFSRRFELGGGDSKASDFLP